MLNFIPIAFVPDNLGKECRGWEEEWLHYHRMTAINKYGTLALALSQITCYITSPVIISLKLL